MHTKRDGNFLTAQELALRWRRSLRSLQRWRQTRSGPRYHRIEGRILYALDDVISFETAHQGEVDE